MREFNVEWSEIKAMVSKGFPLHYRKIYPVVGEDVWAYEVFVLDRMFLWSAVLLEDSQKAEFDTYYKAKANRCIYDDQGKEYQRAESRPLDCTTCFQGTGDSASGIGDGTELAWDFSNDDDVVYVDSNIKRKRIEFKFLDSIYIKEGTLYFHKAKKGSKLNMYVVCPAGYYYYDNNGIPRLAQKDTPIAHYIIDLRFQGDCPMGDEFNTETCSSAIPNYYKFWIDIDVPIEDNESNGYVLLEMYRKRTCVL